MTKRNIIKLEFAVSIREGNMEKEVSVSHFKYIMRDHWIRITNYSKRDLIRQLRGVMSLLDKCDVLLTVASNLQSVVISRKQQLAVFLPWTYARKLKTWSFHDFGDVAKTWNMKYVLKLKVKTHDDRTTWRLRAGFKGFAKVCVIHVSFQFLRGF